ncbi:MAG: tetratricopeptide repeat protein [Nitrospirae bacterium]|nr:tetratricopeptide repeat protein [Nitrospirota bacterium]MDA1303116.1 tetratricopeptide repeat protein [Nitrospirota bacterium]
MQIHIIAFLVIVLCLSAIPTQAEPNRVQRNIEHIQQLWSEGQIGLALTTVEEILTSASDDARLHKLRGDLLLLQRQNAAALTAYDRAISLEPKDIEARWAKWSLLARMGDGAKAIQELKHLTEAEPTNPVLRYR